MTPPTRRSVLRVAGVGLGTFGAGCSGLLGSSGTPSETPTAAGTSTPPETPTRTETPPNETRERSEPDERVYTTPPGSPALDPDGEWPSYRFDAGNTGANPDGRGVRDGTTYWRLNAGGPATVADGTLYNIYRRNLRYAMLTYRDPATATVETRSRLGPAGMKHPPVVADGRVFVLDYSEVLCFDATSGDRLWRAPDTDTIVSSLPTVHDGVVLVNNGDNEDIQPHIRAFDAASGEQRWRYDIGHGSDRITPAVDDGRAFVTSRGGVHAVNIASGDEEFVVEDRTYNSGTPAVADGTVYAPLGNNTDLVAVDAADGTVRWRTPVETRAPPVVSDGTVYVWTADGVARLDAADGSVVTASGVAARPVGLVGDVLYAEEQGALWALDAATDLDTLWTLDTQMTCVSDECNKGIRHVTPVNGAVYVSARDAFYGVGPE